MNKKLTEWPEVSDRCPLDIGNQAVDLEWILELVKSKNIPKSKYASVYITAKVEYIDYDSSAGVLDISYDRLLTEEERAHLLAEYNERFEMNRIDEIKRVNNLDVFQKFLDRLPPQYQEEWRKVQDESQ